MENLNQLRQQINLIDEQIDDLLNQRLNISQNVALYKNKYHQRVYDYSREQQLLNHLATKAQLIFPEGHIYLKQQLMFVSRQYQYQFMQIPTMSTKKYQTKNLGYHQMIEEYVTHLTVNLTSYDSNDKLIYALVQHEIDVAILPSSLDDISVINQLHMHDLYITNYSQYQHHHLLYLSNQQSIPPITEMLGIIITMHNSHAISDIINLFKFYQINIKQLFLLTNNELFIRFLGNYQNKTIQQLLYILTSEQKKMTIKLAY